ncbi:MAG: DNA polymerase III subunit gamma/tau [Firmicutes bacterium]|nr:DNA polymerase III subunit gamma/tau [Bacillota bacterium]
MEYKVLYRKYRPDTFEKIVGQDYTVNILKNAIINEKIAHAYIFNGPRGTGKTSTAKVFAKTINCENPKDGEACGKCNSCINLNNNPDIIEIDAASNNGVDEIRELINNIKIAPSYSKYKVYIIDEVHMMTQSAFNALLLTLEEPPKHVVFILATTNIESVPITILSRCQKFDFKKISNDVIENNISEICKKEKIKITEDAMKEIAYLSEGGMRDALSILDQLASENIEITLDLIIDNFGSVPAVLVDNIIDALNNNEFDLLKENIDKLKNGNVDYKIFIKRLIDKLSYLVFEQGKLNYLDAEKIKLIVFDLIKVINNYNININPFILIELVLIEHLEIKSMENNSKNISREIISNENVQQKEEKNIENSNNEIMINKEIRINNCFVAATKDNLKSAQAAIKKIIEENSDDKLLLSMLVDSSVVAASDKYYILCSSLDSIVKIININHILIEKKLENIKVIALTEEEWLNEKNKYIINLKNNVKYNYIDEEDSRNDTLKIEDVKDSIVKNESMEEIAESLFSSNKIEIE